MKRRCQNADGASPSYATVELRMTLSEWLEWSLPRYRVFIRDHRLQSPNVARSGDAGHYEIGNLEIITAHENRNRQAMPHQLRPDGTKLCITCRELLPAALFGMRRANRDGLSFECRSCRGKYQREYDRKRRGGIAGRPSR